MPSIRPPCLKNSGQSYVKYSPKNTAVDIYVFDNVHEIIFNLMERDYTTFLQSEQYARLRQAITGGQSEKKKRELLKMF